MAEDPLAEELLRGSFAGKDTIMVDIEESTPEEREATKRRKKFVFTGVKSEPDKETPVAAVATNDTGSDSAESDEASE